MVQPDRIISTSSSQEPEIMELSEINVLPTPPQLLCPFSKQENDILELEQRSKATIKLCGLIVFYLLFMAAEITGGMKANSLAVLTDALHLLIDVAGVSISLFSVCASGWKPTARQSFGFSRLEVLGAFLSVQLIWLVSGILTYEAVARITQKIAVVNGKLMFVVAAFGFSINLIMVMWLGHSPSHSHTHHHTCSDKYHGPEDNGECSLAEEAMANLVSSHPNKEKTSNINLEGAYLHIMADLIQSVGVMIAGAIIWVRPEWLILDLICTLTFSVFCLSTTIPLLRNMLTVLMEGTPEEIDLVRVENDLKCIEGVQNVHELHVWSLTVGKFVLVCHVVARPGVGLNDILNRIHEYCEKTYRFHHVTIQVEQE